MENGTHVGNRHTPLLYFQVLQFCSDGSGCLNTFDDQAVKVFVLAISCWTRSCIADHPSRLKSHGDRHFQAVYGSQSCKSPAYKDNPGSLVIIEISWITSKNWCVKFAFLPSLIFKIAFFWMSVFMWKEDFDLKTGTAREPLIKMQHQAIFHQCRHSSYSGVGHEPSTDQSLAGLIWNS